MVLVKNILKNLLSMIWTRPRRAPHLDRARASASGLCLLSGLLVLMTVSTGASASSVDCCPENTVWVSPTSNCSDGSTISLNCRHRGSFYRLTPASNHFDEFTIVDRGGLYLEFLHNYDSIPAHRFCVSGEDEATRWALVCFDEAEGVVATWKYMIFGILSLISAFFLLLTLAVYVVLPELRDIQGKAMAVAVAFLASAYFLLATEQMRKHPAGGDVACVPMAFVLYWAFLSAFFWMNLVAFNVWRTVWFKNFPVKDKDLFLVFCGIGVVGPGVFLLAALVTHHTEGSHLKPHFGENTCWFGGSEETWAFFYGPIAVLLALNVMYLSLTSWRLWFEYRGYSGSALRTLRFNCLLYVKLIVVMGITWIFEVVSFAVSARENDVYWFATDILNALQGLVIFLLLVVTRKRVKRLLSRKRPCGLAFPKSWAAYDEKDEIAQAIDAEMELSNSP